MFIKNIKAVDHQAWLKQALGAIPQASRILDVGAGELQNRQHYYGHLNYVLHDFCQYQGGGGTPDAGLQNDGWSTTRVDLVSDNTAIPAQNASFDAIFCSEVWSPSPRPPMR